MKSAEVKLRRFARMKARRYSDWVTTLYWRYSHQVYGDLNKGEPW